MASNPDDAWVDLDGRTYQIVFVTGGADAYAKPSDDLLVAAISRRLHFGTGPLLKRGGGTWRRVLKAFRDQQAKGGRGHV